MKIGFIGLGIMGKPMAKNLLKAGHELYVNDHNAEAVAEVVEAGATAVANGKEAAEKADLVITMLPNSPHVKAVALGEGGIIEGAREGLIYVDMSSIAPLASREVAAGLEKAGVRMLDAPVSGGEPKAIDGTMSVMVGGEEELFNEVKDVLGVMAGDVTYVGPIGAGNIAKLANQAIVAINIAACAEAFTMAQKAGVDPEAVYRAIRGGLAGSTVMDAKVPMMLARNFKPGFRINLHIKDLNNVMDTGHGVNSALPLTAQVREMMSVLEGDDHAGEDHSSLVRFYEKLANIELHPGLPE
ncbi:2-hydroxy-3-oxopropionate reductase [Actinotignum schaalii]|uniref:2-hydroxy-3-oxopropionate reductase n=1 Tax=Actinotignum schaalii FB123-CNA-2 TaxID=883067 RepID=S2VPG7_9ACTO|nr:MULTISPECIES: 2-hydroxy-3-oxopropionate reductase [Actinotignum]EPD27920.1 2-hydroxy-3-oxopropionate reductase [Actinotignum schaalii FB123-CNA-2]MDE1564804.1 2-hydroxy-3-oxopropionate reductase [Actinotignum sanguinis]MDE1576547.1 2-hydroxy-3-oxopropionate reductase [Actinotignum sanguinis]MDE1641556.1 2-hydroxy-3-oxopropionate reductase [Actinotignum sanguinis]MDK8287624.1 2-hydroxy-3-oxopropionate reductase [Actinotignum sanguinis]